MKKIFAIVSITLFLVFLMVTQGGTNDYSEVYFTGGEAEAVDSQPLAGQIIADSDTKMWLAYNRDFNVDGKKDPFFMCGPGDPEGFLYRGTRNSDGTRNGDQMTLINKMKGTGANSIYLMAVRSHGGDGDSTQNPFVDSDPTKALDGDILNQWETWFTEMDNNGIIIFFFFYDDSARIWDTGDAVGAEESAFIQGLVNRFEHHRNLIWCVAEEYEESFSATRVSNIAAEIRATDDHNHVIAVHKLTGLDFSEFANDPNIDQFAIQYKVSTISANHAGMVTAWDNANGRYNINLAEPDNTYGTVEFSRQRNWAVAMGGAYIMPIEWDIASTDIAYLEDCGRLVRFMESTNLSEMAPHDEVVISGTGYCLANPGGEYVIYLPEGGSVTVDLSDATGTLNVEWYDPKEGTYYDEETITGGGSETFTPLFSGDAVLHILLSTGVNLAPVAQDQSVTTTEDTPTAITLVATDVDGNTLTYSIVTQPLHGTVSGAAPNMTYTPDANYNGSDSFTFRANDGTVDSNVATVSITVTSVNDVPVAQDQSVTTDEDTARAITLVATDVDSDTLTYSIVTQPSHGTRSGIPPDVTYTPYADYHGSDSFTFRANDGTVDSNVAAVSITVTSVNDAPVAQDQSVTTDEDTPTAITLVATDVDSDTLTYSIVTQPSHGTLSGIPPDVTYTPYADYHGSDSFTFRANDGLLDSNVAAVSITVTSVNDAPVAQDQSVTTTEDTPTAITLVATDVDGDTLTYSIVTQPLHGTLSGAAPNVTYTPDANYHGSDSFTFKANDGLLDSNVATVSITVGSELIISNLMVASGKSYEVVYSGLVEGAFQYIDRSYTFSAVPGSITGATYIKTANNDKNRAEPDFLSFDVNQAVTIYVAHDDRIVPRPSWLHDFVDTGEDMLSDDPECSPFSLFIKDFPQGTLSLGGNIDSSIPADTKRSMYTVVIVGTGSSTNHAPEAQDQSVTTDEDTARAITLVATDVDDDPLTYSIVTQPLHGTLSGTVPDVTYTPDTNYNGSDSFTFKANDGTVDSNVATVSIAVPAPETIPPLVSNPSANPDVIPDDTDNDPRWGETSQINVTVTDDSGVLSVTINLSAIGGSPTQSMTSIPDTNTWTVSTNASAGTAPGIYHLKINATDTNGNSNTSVSVELRVMKNGDIDGDGTVTHDDSEYLANYLTKIPGYGEIEEVVADVDEQVDECVTIADYEYLKNHISGEPGYEKLH